MKNENVFQASLIRTLKNVFPGCIVLKNDPNYIQGIPDLLVLYGPKWIALECKRSADEPHRPNQDYYIDLMDKMSFARFIYPENCQSVLEQALLFFESNKQSDNLFMGDFLKGNNYQIAAWY